MFARKLQMSNDGRVISEWPHGKIAPGRRVFNKCQDSAQDSPCAETPKRQVTAVEETASTRWMYIGTNAGTWNY